MFAEIDVGVEHPELDIFDVGLFKVSGFKFTHHTAPLCLRLSQGTIAVQVEGQIVRAAFLGIIGQVEHGEGRGGATVG